MWAGLGWAGWSLSRVLLSGLEYGQPVARWPPSHTYPKRGWPLTRVTAVSTPHVFHHPVGWPEPVNRAVIVEFSKATREGKAQCARTISGLCLSYDHRHSIGQSKSHSPTQTQKWFSASSWKSHSEGQADGGGRNLGATPANNLMVALVEQKFSRSINFNLSIFSFLWFTLWGCLVEEIFACLELINTFSYLVF